jgi:lambda repressor-like predicted transcriptional regulator
MRHFGTFLKKQIAAQGLDIKEFASRAHVGANTLYVAFREPEPAAKDATIGKIALALGVRPEELITAWKSAGTARRAVSNRRISMSTDEFLTWFEKLPSARKISIFGAIRAHVEIENDRPENSDGIPLSAS